MNRRRIPILGLILVAALLCLSFDAHSRSLPPYPFAKPSREKPRPAPLINPEEKAIKLYKYARKENPRLRWDECLAKKAYQRARQMVKRDYFEHNDPRTGENPSWDLVIECFRCRFAGENLSKGYDSPETVHDALMRSRTHRKNIKDTRFTLLGVGCYDYICVQLFAGL